MVTLSRRTRALFLDARAAIESAPVVASLMAKEMDKEESWEKAQVASFYGVAGNYLAAGPDPQGNNNRLTVMNT